MGEGDRERESKLKTDRQKNAYNQIQFGDV